jgi:hypothetical protein
MRQRLSGHPVVTLVLFAAAIAWVGAAQQSLSEQGSSLYAIFAASPTILLYGWIGIPILSLVLLPAMVVTMVPLHRIDPKSRGARFAIGGAGWAGWAFVIWLATLSIPPESQSPGARGSALAFVVVAALVGGLF